MLRDGQYAAWFRTSRGQGTCVVQLESGRISGGDSFFDYSGTYELDGDRFTATLTTGRRANGPTTVFGVDEVVLKLTGTLNGTIACCSGRSEQAPDIHFEATLFLGSEPPSRPEPQRVAPNLSSEKVARLPSLDNPRYRARNLLGPGSGR